MTAAEAGNGRRPNLLVIVLDQLRYDCLGRTSNGRVATPHLDQLASAGTSFEHAYSHLPTCCPARQSLLNGRRPESFGALWNYDSGPPIASLVPDGQTWPELLGEGGYRSAYFGKWHVSPHDDPTDFGYGTYVGRGAYHDMRRRDFPEVTYQNGRWGEVDPLPLEAAETHWFARQAAETIQTFADEPGPWHVRMDLVEPHLPCRPVAEFAAHYAPEDVPEWPSFAETFADKPYIQRQQLASWGVEGFTWEDWAPIVARYLAVISQADDAIGRVLDALDRTGQRDSTIVVVTTDHGDLCGAHRMMDKHYVLYDDVVRVPLIICWPGTVAPDKSREEFVYNLLDLPPTLLDLVGLPVPASMVGRSLRPLLSDDTSPDDWREEVVCTYNGQQFGLFTQRSIRTSDWKYIWNATDVDELYHLAEDPHELRNLASHAGCREILTVLRRRLYEILDDEGDRQVQNPWVRQQLLEGTKV